MGKTKKGGGGKEQIKIMKKKLYKKWRSRDSNLYPKVYDLRKREKKKTIESTGCASGTLEKLRRYLI